VIRGVKRVWVLALSGLLAGCGGGGRHGSLTVPAYGPYSSQTISGASSPAECSKDARLFARDALLLLAHSGASAAYPADLYYVIIREDFTDFQARRCDPKLLGAELRGRLTETQRRDLIADLPYAMGAVIQKGLAQ
jgi:hypothetical protein